MNYIENENLLRDVITKKTENYWLVRTMGGNFYGDYIRNGFIAIGCDEVDLGNLNEIPQKNEIAKEYIKSKFEKVYPEKESARRRSYLAGQIFRFICELNIGDYVIIPDRGSHAVCFGKITSDVYVEEKIREAKEACPFKRRRNVEWLKNSYRYNLNPSLQLCFNSRHAISNINSYSCYIDSLLNDFYLKENEAHFVLRVTTEEDIDIANLFSLNSLFELTDKFIRSLSIIDDEKINVKIQLESPGSVRFGSKSIKKLLYAATLAFFINGGGADFNLCGIHLKSNGFIQNINTFLNDQANRELKAKVIKSFESLKIENPNDLRKILEVVLKDEAAVNKENDRME